MSIEKNEMTIEEINAKIAELDSIRAELCEARDVQKRRKFDTMTDNILSALRELKKEYPYAELVVEIDGDECVDLFSRSDLLKENLFSMN